MRWGADVNVLAGPGRATPPTARPRLHPLSPEASAVRHTVLPLYHRAGCVALVDDDADFMDTLRWIMPRDWRIRSFHGAPRCIEQMRAEAAMSEPDLAAQREIARQWEDGAPMIPLVLRYWNSQPEPLQLTSVCIMDYGMPGLDGLEALRQLGGWAGCRVLLTGSQGNDLPGAAFDLQLVDRVVYKHSPTWIAELIQVVDSLLLRPDPRYDVLWGTTLGPGQLALLRTASVGRELTAYAQEHFSEWVVLGEPFGVLGRDRAGSASWLQLEHPQRLDALAREASELGVDDAARAEIRAGRQLPNFELRRALGLGGVQLVDALQVGEGQDMLLAGRTRIEVPPERESRR